MKKPVVLVTGASQGLGAAIARTFAAGVSGARLALVARGARVRLATDARALKYGGDFPTEEIHEIASATPTTDSIIVELGGLDSLSSGNYVVWVGNDENKSTGLYGATGAMRVWSVLFRKLLSQKQLRSILVPLMVVPNFMDIG